MKYITRVANAAHKFHFLHYLHPCRIWAQNQQKLVEVSTKTNISTANHQLQVVDIIRSEVEISIYNTSTARILIWAPFDKISKSGDGGGSGGSLRTNMEI